MIEADSVILDRISALDWEHRRRLVALAGPPASGKSTLAETLVSDLRARGCPATLVPMDGFHLENPRLVEMGLLHRKGAPETFDLAGFADLIARLPQEDVVPVPVFDRTRDCTVPGAARVSPNDRVVVIEGNYLLLDEPGWRDLASHWDVSIWIDVPEAVLKRRLVQRWLDHGLDPDAAEARAEGNDMANARRIAAHRLPADMVVTQAG
ncbi:nucleoside triphosphate hydrolase [Silicimonas algicola]|uniref:Fructokinase n=1 Tax=Silicimonas algicola TaxID=1826607 RepID=A0A316G8X0_9RHOB|nr:nucleoside triphosphate hydrolase [Silicimonas algicola]AZQ69381.1 nucleoside triphosphate hydrolase [Silicimonas algicola]PWK56446.1 fructokinase [Silicimonas algicola]